MKLWNDAVTLFPNFSDDILLKLTNLPLDKMATMLQTTFLTAFSWMKILHFDSNCTEIGS